MCNLLLGFLLDGFRDTFSSNLILLFLVQGRGQQRGQGNVRSSVFSRP